MRVRIGRDEAENLVKDGEVYLSAARIGAFDRARIRGEPLDTSIVELDGVVHLHFDPADPDTFYLEGTSVPVLEKNLARAGVPESRWKVAVAPAA